MKAMRAKPFMDLSGETVERLRRGIPGVRHWIERYIADPVHVYRTLDPERFRRLPAYFSPALLQKVRVATVERIEVAPVTHLGPFVAEFEQVPTMIIAASAKNHIFILPGAAESESAYVPQLVRIIQWDEIGTDLFLFAYFVLLAEVGFRNSPLIDLPLRIGGAFDRGEAVPDLEETIRRETREIVEPYRALLVS